MSAFTVPYLAGALLLAVAGLSKVVSPDSTVEAARSGGLPLPAPAVRLMATVETIAGAAALTVDAWLPPIVVGTFYLGFACFLGLGLVRGNLRSCGCFAGDRAKPSWLHVTVDVGFAAAALGVFAEGSQASLKAAHTAGDGFATTVLVLITAALAYVVLSHLPEPGAVPARMLMDESAGAR